MRLHKNVSTFAWIRLPVVSPLATDTLTHLMEMYKKLDQLNSLQDRYEVENSGAITLLAILDPDGQLTSASRPRPSRQKPLGLGSWGRSHQYLPNSFTFTSPKAILLNAAEAHRFHCSHGRLGFHNDASFCGGTQRMWMGESTRKERENGAVP